MKLECGYCGHIFTFLMENVWWGKEEMKEITLTCSNCDQEILIHYYIPDELLKALGGNNGA